MFLLFLKFSFRNLSVDFCNKKCVCFCYKKAQISLCLHKFFSRLAIVAKKTKRKSSDSKLADLGEGARERRLFRDRSWYPARCSEMKIDSRAPRRKILTCVFSDATRECGVNQVLKQYTTWRLLMMS